jgi:hypothetical protein
MFRLPLFLLTFVLACALASLTQAQCEQRPADELTPAQHEQLRRDKLIIGSKNYTQIFSPYITLGKSPDSIRFITSDAALAAYHALFEDSFRELELHRAIRLRGDLEELYKSCRRPSQKDAGAPELIQHILGPALVVLGTPATTDYFSQALLQEIKRQASLIQAAKAVECPAWLDYKNTPDFKIDYRRCKPVSFYAGNPTLENYHRVVRWLQMAPLRPSNNRELETWAHMIEAANPGAGAPGFQRSFAGLSNFVGPLDDRGIITNDPVLLNIIHRRRDDDPAMPLKLQTAILASAPRGTSLNELRFHVMPPHALPETEIMLQCLENNITPNGLTVAAYLGSDFARERMPKVDSSNWNKWCAQAHLLTLPQDGAPRSLYIDYLDLLRTLNDPPIKNAPAFMRAQPWLAKTCQTQLAGWTQMRHTFALQSKTAIFFESAKPEGTPPGFIEPNPAFWRDYSRLIERTISMLDAQHVFERSPAIHADEIRREAGKLESLGLHLPTATLDTLAKLKNRPEPDLINLLGESLRWLAKTGATHSPDFTYAAADKMQADYSYAIDWLRTSADKIERGELVIEEKYPRYQSLSERWQILVILARQLETILARQLAEIELTEAECALIIFFGETLAESMGFFGDSKWAEPLPDTSPKWVEVAHKSFTDQSFAAATGRARALYVLYPWRRRELLCTGAVLSYYEEWSPTKRLTDEEWKAKLDSPAAPPPPDWLAPILAR